MVVVTVVILLVHGPSKLRAKYFSFSLVFSVPFHPFLPFRPLSHFLFTSSMTTFVLMSYKGRRVVPHHPRHTYYHIHTQAAHNHSTWSPTQLPSERANAEPFPARIITTSQPSASKFGLQTDGAVGSEIHLLQFLCLMCRTRLHSTGHREEVWCLCALRAHLNTNCAPYFDVACLWETCDPPLMLLYHAPCILEHASFNP